MKKKVIIFSILAAMIMLVGMFAMLSDAKALVFVPASLYANGPPTVTTGNIKYFSNGGFIGWDYGFVIPNAIVIGLTTYYTTSTSTWSFVFDPHTDIITSYFNAVWTVNSSPWNGFKGQIVMVTYNFNPATDSGSTTSVHVVAYGFGIFRGDTLILSCYGLNAAYLTWTGYVIMP